MVTFRHIFGHTPSKHHAISLTSLLPPNSAIFLHIRFYITKHQNMIIFVCLGVSATRTNPPRHYINSHHGQSLVSSWGIRPTIGGIAAMTFTQNESFSHVMSHFSNLRFHSLNPLLPRHTTPMTLFIRRSSPFFPPSPRMTNAPPHAILHHTFGLIPHHLRPTTPSLQPAHTG